MISPPVHLHELLVGWQTDWMSLLALGVELGIAVWYVLAVARLARRGRRWSPWRTASFLLGTASVVVAIQSGLASYDDSVFEVHVIQHLLLMNVAPILYALAAPVTLALQASDRQTQHRLLSVLHSKPVEFITHPVLVVINFAGTMLVFFLTPFYQFSLEHPLLHEFTHLHFLVSGILYWWLVVGIDPSRWRLSFPAKLGYLLVGVPTSAILGLALTESRTSIAPLFHTTSDTHAGGAILWIVGELFTLSAVAIVVIQWMRVDSREAARNDRRLAANEVLGGGNATQDGPTKSGPSRAATAIAVTVVDGRLVAADGSAPSEPTTGEVGEKPSETFAQVEPGRTALPPSSDRALQTVQELGGVGAGSDGSPRSAFVPGTVAQSGNRFCASWYSLPTPFSRGLDALQSDEVVSPDTNAYQVPVSVVGNTNLVTFFVPRVGDSVGSGP